MAAGLRALGLRRDDRVMLVMSDEIPMLTGILGAFRAGLVAVPVSTMFTGAELGKIMADSGARVVLATPEFADAVGEAVAASPDVEHAVLAGEGRLLLPDRVAGHSWDELIALGRHGDGSIAPTVDDSWALWLYTSGTTGLPKAAMHRHANIRHVCETYGAQVLAITPDDTTFSVAKMFFAYGIGNTVFFPLSVGASTVLEPRRPSPDVVRERLEETRPTLFFGVPTFYAALTASDVPAEAFSSVRMCASAGEPLPAPLQRRFTDRFGVEILDGIGSTEALHIFLSNRPGDIRPGTTGLPVPGYDVEVRDATGQLVPDDEPGALHVRGESIALGYWHRTDASRQVFQGEWLVTGDTYVRNAEGYYTCLGRNSDMLKAGGIWVSPGEVESRLLEHPSVREAAVVGVPDADGLDKPIAVVVVARGQRPARGGPGGLVPRRARALQGAPQGGVRDRPAQDRHRQAAALQGPRPRRPRPRRRAGARADRRARGGPVSAREVDLLIVGAGPVGLYGAYYAGVRGLSVAVVDSLSEVGGQVTAMYPEKQIYDVAGFPAISGRDLVRGLVAQAAARVRRTCSARRPSSCAPSATAGCTSPPAAGTEVTCGALVVTGGIGTFTPRPLPAGEEFLGRGLEYFVPSSQEYVGRDVVVVGGGDSALDWALMLEPLAVQRHAGAPARGVPGAQRQRRPGPRLRRPDDRQRPGDRAGRR